MDVGRHQLDQRLCDFLTRVRNVCIVRVAVLEHALFMPHRPGGRSDRNSCRSERASVADRKLAAVPIECHASRLATRRRPHGPLVPERRSCSRTTRRSATALGAHQPHGSAFRGLPRGGTRPLFRQRPLPPGLLGSCLWCAWGNRLASFDICSSPVSGSRPTRRK
jgi:hypothetical protein